MPKEKNWELKEAALHLRSLGYFSMTDLERSNLNKELLKQLVVSGEQEKGVDTTQPIEPKGYNPEESMKHFNRVEYPDGKGFQRHGSPIFYDLLKEMAETHDKKSHDYALDNNPYGNYTFAGLISSLFSHSPDDAGFAGRIAEKIYRLSVLGKRGTAPKNEAIDDTERDIAVIATLWMAMRREKRSKENQSVEYAVGERYPGPPNALGCDEKGVKVVDKF